MDKGLLISTTFAALVIVAMLGFALTINHQKTSVANQQTRDSVVLYRSLYLECNGDHKRTSQFYDSLGMK